MHNYFLTVLPPLAFRGGRNGGKTRASRATTGPCLNVTLSEEHLAYRWVTPAELPSYRLHGSLQRSLKQMKQFSYEKSHALLRGFLSAI